MGSGINIVSEGSLKGAAALASTFYSARKDLRGLQQDLGKSLGKTNVSEFMRTEKFLDRILDNSRSRSREIVELYQNAREIPGAAQVLGPVENYARAEAWKQFGGNIAQQTISGLQEGFQKNTGAVKQFFYGEAFDGIASGTSQAIDTLARLGLAIQGVQLLVGPLASAWGSAFDAIIGQNVRLEQTMLSTQTTLASTGRILDRSTGQILTDPMERITALEGDVRTAIDNIRVRSLDLAGVTSSQIIDIFGVVATSISQVNGSIKDAEDLAISFTAALGTLGIPFHQARQEIGSILGGYITEDSLLARRLQISNQDIQKAKQSIDGVTGYLKKKLEVAVAGQAISAKSFAGVTSNIAEVFQIIGQRIGAPLLGPLVGGLTVIYNILKEVQELVSQLGGYLASTFVGVVQSIAGIFARSGLVKGLQRGIATLSAPYKDFARSLELGLDKSGRSVNLLQDWVTGVRAVPPAFQGLVRSLVSLGAFLQQQISLIVEPILQLLDQTRERLSGGWEGATQGFSRVSQFILGEGPDAFTKGWDSITSTIEYAAQAVVKFGSAIVRLKIVEFTATIRAAAKVFELFGSMFLGKLNLAVAFFDSIAGALNNWEIFGANVAEVVVSFTAINKLLNATETFGIKGLLIWAFQTSKIFQQLRLDAQLFIKGFRDAGNINNLIKNAQDATNKVFAVQAQSKNPALANLAEIEQLKARLESLKKVQTELVAPGPVASQTLMAKYAKDVTTTTQAIKDAQKAQEKFKLTQKATAAASAVFGGGAEIAQAKEVARQAGVMASGASAAQALSSVMDTLGQRLGLTREQMKGLGGAVTMATRSIQTFLTTSLLINLAFAALTIGISTGITAWQQYESRVQSARMEALRMAQVQQILSSGYSSIIKAADGGDIAAQRRLQEAQDIASSAFQIQQDKKNKLVEKEAELNDRIWRTRQALGKLKGYEYAEDFKSYTALENKLQKERNANKKEQEAIDLRILQIEQARIKLVKEQDQAKNFEVLGERRLDLEDRIKKAREDFEKEITDKNFQSRMEVLGLEQQRRQEIQNQELTALRERFALIKSNAVQDDQRVLALAEEYATALQTAANNEINLKQEYFQKEQQIRKAIEDYAFKLQRERSALEKQVGSYRKQVADYERKQTEIRVQTEIQAARQRQVLNGVNWQPSNTEQQQKFINGAQRIGLSVPDAFAMLQAIPKENLKVDGTTDAEVVLQRLRTLLDARATAGAGTDVNSIVQAFAGMGADPRDLVQKLKDLSVQVLDLGRWLKPENKATIATPSLDIDYEGMEARIASSETSVLAALKELQDTRQAGDTQRIQQIIDKVSAPGNFSELKGDYYSPLLKSKNAVEDALTDLRAISDPVTGVESLERQLTQERRRITASFTGQLRAFLKDTIKLSGPALTEAFERYSTTKLTNPRNSSERFVQGMQTGYLADLNNATATSKDRAAIDTNTRLVALVKEVEQDLTTLRNSNLQDILSRFSAATQSATSGAYSLAKAQADISQRVLTFAATKLAEFKTPLTPENVAQLQESIALLANGLFQSAQRMDPFNKALQVFQTRLELSNRATEAWVSGYKTFLGDIIQGTKSLKDATAAFSESIAKEFTNMFVDYIGNSIKDNVKATFDRLFGVNKAKEQAENAMITALGGNVTATDQLRATMVDLINTIKNPTAGTATTGAPTPTPLPPSADPSAPVPIPTVPYQETPGTAATNDAAAAAQTATTSLTNLAYTSDDFTKGIAGANTQANGLPGIFQGLKSNISGFVNVLGGVAMGFGGLQQMQGGGTYNTLMGMAGIFGSIASIAGTFAGPKALGSIFGARAAGGPTRAHTPYYVGENGTELWMPETNGRIIPNNQLPPEDDPYADTLSYLGGSASTPRVSNAPIRIESHVINRVEYATIDQLEAAATRAEQRGAQMGAERGRALALSTLQNSTKTRKKVGI